MDNDENDNIIDDSRFQFSRLSKKFDLIDQLELEEAQEEVFQHKLFVSQFDTDLIEGRAFA